MGAVVQVHVDQANTFVRENGGLRDIWDNGYFWKDAFTVGADNRLMLTRIIDRLTVVSLQMAEKHTAANDLSGYYKYVTGENIPKFERERLNVWVFAGYDPRDYPILSELELSLRRSREIAEYDDSIDMVSEVTGRRKGGMIIFSEDDIYENK
ncbi:hypothetical protein [Paenibacillus sp. DMB20]|uniref:hypothetical protein n=1 Tax=Paenibacillus sp. DMB20 TaxID=1642570 RepID=UPI0006280C99|nr:hypothetical protein [Paenibacillus sp. DMB20]KKO54498.1 hypothetical protein XI25_06845 [Paenibacillus sp. DMB20]